MEGYPARRGVPWSGPAGGYPAGGYPGQVPPIRPGQDGGYPAGGTLVRYPPARSGGGYPAWGVPWPGTPPHKVRTGGGYPGRTTEGVLNTRRAVCLLRSRRRTFLFYLKKYRTGSKGHAHNKNSVSD